MELQASGATIELRVLYKEQASSLLALVAGPSTHATAPAVAVPSGTDLRGRLAPVTPAAGNARTEFGAPVWLSDLGASAGMLQDRTFDRLGAAGALDRILVGSMSFDAHCAPFYTPPRIEILHEMLHAAHDARGLNREARGPPTGPAGHLWTDGEEYWTIAADPLGENMVGAEIGLPNRCGHGGIPLLGLAHGTEQATETLRAHARR